MTLADKEIDRFDGRNPYFLHFYKQRVAKLKKRLLCRRLYMYNRIISAYMQTVWIQLENVKSFSKRASVAIWGLYVQGPLM